MGLCDQINSDDVPIPCQTVHCDNCPLSHTAREGFIDELADPIDY